MRIDEQRCARKQQGVAISRCARYGFRADDCAGAGPVFDNETVTIPPPIPLFPGRPIEVTDVGALAAGAFCARKISRAFQRRAQRDGRLSSATVRAVTSMFMCGSDR
jgi:hypothetical protein